MDADGTCDPNYFAEMCRMDLEESADVVLGSRLGPDSKMPPIRQLGNRIYAFLIGILCGRRVTDTASGMRVLRRASLKYLYSLPDGLHFMPSMSAKALLNDLRVTEIAMRCEERVGCSKLSIFRDGVRFLQTIFDGVLCYRPERILLMGFLGCMGIIVLLGIYPTEFYLKSRQLEEWMIYRFLVCHLFGSIGLMFLLSTALVNRMASFGPRRQEAAGFWSSMVAMLLRGWFLGGILLGFVALTLMFLRSGNTLGRATFRCIGHV